MHACMDAGKLVAEEPYEIVGYDDEETHGPREFRMNRAAGDACQLLRGMVIHVEGAGNATSSREEFESLAMHAGATVVSEHPGIANTLEVETTVVVVLNDALDSLRQSKYLAVETDYLLDCIMDYTAHDQTNYDLDGDNEEDESGSDGDDGDDGLASQDMLASSPPLF